jgi:hypothetical protein
MEVMGMPKLVLDMSLEDIKDLAFQLPAKDFLMLLDAIEERAETVAMTQVSETGFQEWNEEGEG